MKHINLKNTPNLSDCVSFLYLEMAKIEQDEYGLVAIKGANAYHIPVTTFACILLGPGTTISHAAMKNIADAGTFVVWCRRNCEGMYVAGRGRTASNKNLIMQAKCFSDKKLHTKVARNMYKVRYPEAKLATLSIKEMMGIEGKSMREAYERFAKETGVEWNGRDYKDAFENQTAINQALSIANNILYDICHICLLSIGFSPDLGFIHTGNAESFVFDVADIYKERISIPCAFECAKFGKDHLNERIRKEIHKYIKDTKFLKTFANDMKAVFKETGAEVYVPNEFCLWTPDEFVKAGVSYEEKPAESESGESLFLD